MQRSPDHDPLDEATIDEEDDVRFALTSEAGLNDGTAFPFVHAAISLAAGTAGTAAASGLVASWLPRWLAWELVGKIALGVAVGLVVGWVLGYGFLAVFVCGVTIRAGKRSSAYHLEASAARGVRHVVLRRARRRLPLLPRVRRGRAPLRRGTMEVVDHRPDDPRLGRRAPRPLDARRAPARRGAPTGSVLTPPLSRSGAHPRRR